MVGPGERFRGRVVAADEVEQLRFEVFFARERPAPEQAAGEDGEEQLDLVEPGGVGRGEVEVPARVRVEPGDDLGCLVDLEVVEDRVDLLAGGDLRLEELEEVEELEPAVAVVDVADDLAGVDEQRSEQGDGAVALVLELARAALPGVIGISVRIGSLARTEVFSSIETTIAPSSLRVFLCVGGLGVVGDAVSEVDA